MIARQRLAPALAVLGAMTLGFVLVLPHMELPASFDGAKMYLPLARRLLAEGMAFLRSPESVMFAPLAYVYPAILGADEITVRWSNVLLYLATAALAYDAGRHAHSRTAGVIAAFLVALSPALHLYAADVLTEPLFMFAIALWAVAVARVVARPESRAWGWVAVGAVALTVAPLTRPAAMLFAPAMALMFAVRSSRRQGAERRVELRLVALHAVAIVGPALWILRNHVLFGVTSIATGLGGALWLGLDPLVDGFDPLYFGMDFDANAVARDMSHLSVEGDRILRGAALLQLRDIPLITLVHMLGHKLLAFLAVTSSEISSALVPQRGWRIAMLALAAFGIFWNRRNTLVLALAAFALYMVAVHVPLLYHHRYTVGALDIPLTLLAAVGLAACMGDRVRAGVCAVIVILAVGAGLMQLAYASPGSPRVDRVPGQLLFRSEFSSIPGVTTEGMTGREAGGFVLGRGAALMIPISFESRLAAEYTVAILGIRITPARRRPACSTMRLRFRDAAQRAYAPHRAVDIPIRADGRMRALIVGTTHPLRLSPNGVLRIEFECPASTLEMGQVTVVAPRRAQIYHDRYMRQREADP